MMPLAWVAQIESASWDGCDLAFCAITAEGELPYIVRARRLHGVTQRTAAEALLLNLPMLKTALIKLTVSGCPVMPLTLE